MIRLPAGRIAATPALVRRLIASQFPHWADQPVRPVDRHGWDNRSFRLGDDLLIRMPTAHHYAAQVAAEQQWLPVLAPQVPLPIPHPVGHGQPTADFPWPWSIYGWLPGVPADADPRLDQTALAGDLAGFLLALQRADSSGGPTPGARNFHRGGQLAQYDSETRAAIAALGESINGKAALALWGAALATHWAAPPVWLHGDIALDNLLVREGRLSAVIDFGCCAVGDPACDLAIAWRSFDLAARQTFLAACGLDDGTVLRGAGWALWKALIVLAARPGTNPAGSDVAGTVITSLLDSFAS